jgi:MoxR-like ATPase
MQSDLSTALEALSEAVAARVPVLLWGGPGTGKSSAVRDLAPLSRAYPYLERL